MEIQVTKSAKSLPFTLISSLFLSALLFSCVRADKGEVLKEQKTKGYGGSVGFHREFGYESPYLKPGYGHGYGYGYGYESPYTKPGYGYGYVHNYGYKPEYGYSYRPRFGYGVDYDQPPYFKPRFGYGDGYGFKPEFGHGTGYGYKPFGELKEDDAAAAKLKANNDGETAARAP